MKCFQSSLQTLWCRGLRSVNFLDKLIYWSFSNASRVVPESCSAACAPCPGPRPADTAGTRVWVCFRRALLTGILGSPGTPLHAATCHMSVCLSWCHAQSACSNLKGFVSGRGATWEVDYWRISQSHCYINKFDTRKQFVWFHHNIFMMLN